MALLQTHVPDIEKKNLDINVTKYELGSMTKVVRDFIAKLNSTPEATIQFLYPTQS